MECCDAGGEPPLPEVEVSREETYEFSPDSRRTTWVNLLVAAASCAILTFLLRLPGAPMHLPLATTIVVALGLGLAVFLVLALPHFGGDVLSQIRMFPRGVEVFRRDGTHDMLTWPEIRGYVYQKDYIILLTEDRSVSIRLLGLSQVQIATIRAALRLRLKHGSMEWRGRASASRARGADYSVLASILCILACGALLHLGYRKWTGTLFVVSLAYFLLAFLRRRGADKGAGEKLQK